MVRLRQWFDTFLRWFTRGASCSHLQVTLYTRQGCHLCEDVWVLLHREQQRHGFTLTVVDVDTDPRTVAEYGNCVPVVAVDDKVRFRGQVNPVLFTRLLQAEASRQDRPRQP